MVGPPVRGADVLGARWHVPNAPAVSTGAFAERTASLSGRTARLRRVGRRQLRLLGSVVPALRESVEMLYEFEDDWVVDHASYAAVLGDHATPLDEALAATVASFGPVPVDVSS